MHKNTSENTLNPPPYKYKVSFLTKIIFLILFILSIIFYFYINIDRRVSQRKFILENQIAARRLSPVLMPHLIINDRKTRTDSDLYDYRGQWLLLNIWATWCPSCQEEMPSLELLHQKIGDRIKIIALSIDDNIEALDEFIKINNPSFKVFHDSEHKSSSLLGISKYPETFMISPDGLLKLQLSGARDWASPLIINYILNTIKNS
jgi:thiol-disulfide isomerase/thioredoxin